MSRKVSTQEGRKASPMASWALWGPLFLLALVLAYHAPVLFGGRVTATLDASRFFYPVWAWGARAWSEGIIPLWNPDSGCGTPYASDPQTASFYPFLRLAYALLPPVQAFHGLIVFHQAWALFGFWIYARRRGWNVWAALSGALAFGFSTTLVSASWTPVALFAASWIPWVFATGEALKDARPMSGPAFFVCMALQGLSGYPVLPYLTGLFLWVHLLWGFSSAAPKREWPIRLALWQILAMTANLLWLMPFLEVLPLGSLSPDGRLHHLSLGWDALKTFGYPFALGHPLEEGYRGPPYWVGSFYIGWAAPLLVLAGFWMSLRRRVIRLLEYLPAVLVLWLSLGDTAYLGRVLRFAVPGWDFVLRSGFLLPLLSFLLAALSARVLDAGCPSVADFNLQILIGGKSLQAKEPGSSHLWGIMAVLLALVSLLPVAWSLNGTMPASYYLGKPAPWGEPPNGSRLFHTPPLLEGTMRIGGSSREDAYNSAKARLIPNWPLLYGWSTTAEYNSFGLKELRDWKREVFRVSPRMSRRALDYLGAGLIVGGSDLPGLETVGEAVPGTPVYRNPSVMPRWFTVGQSMWAPAQEAEWGYMDLKGLDFRQIAFLDKTEGQGTFGKRMVREAPRTLNRVYLKVEGWTGKRSLLVSSEAAAPGWKAWANGKPKSPIRVNHVFRGLVLQDGDAEIRWSYEPMTFRLGLFLSLVSWAAGLGWAAGLVRKQRT